MTKLISEIENIFKIFNWLIKISLLFQNVFFCLVTMEWDGQFELRK